MKKYSLLLLFVATLFNLVACNIDGSRDRGDVELVSITHKVSKFKEMNGETKVYVKEEVTEEMMVNPKRIVTFSWGIADIFNYFGLDYLGIEELGLPTQESNIPNLISGLNNFETITAGTLFIIDYNVIDLMSPDLIILDGRTSGEYEYLKEHYPHIDVLDTSITTYSLEDQIINFNNIGKLFPKMAEALNDKLDEFQLAFENIASQVSNYSASFIMLNGEKYTYQIGKNSRYGLLYTIFNFKEADPNGDVYENNSHGYEFSGEYLKDVNPDVIFLMDRNMIVNNQPSDQTFLRNPILDSVSAIANNYVYNLNAEAWYTITGGIVATTQMIADINQFLNTLDNSN